MLKITKIALLVLLALTSQVFAQVEVSKGEFDSQKVFITGFDNYEPWGTYNAKEMTFDTVFTDFITAMDNRYNMRLHLNFESDYNERVREVRRGDIDLIFGIYYDTETYEGLEYIYPAVTSNPITIVMLPERITKVKNIDDLKSLKGARHTGEKWSDYVDAQVKSFDIVEVSNSYELYGKLFRGEVDYLFIGHYFGQIEAIKLGIENEVSFSKNVIWDMPLFVGVSKMTEKRGFLRGVIQKLSEDPNAKAKIQERIQEEIERCREENRGTVPPSYSIY